MSKTTKSQIIQFVYDYETLDPDIIRQAVPDSEVFSSEEIHNIIQEDYEKINRQVEHSIKIYNVLA